MLCQINRRRSLSAEITAFGASLALVTVPVWGTALEYLS